MKKFKLLYLLVILAMTGQQLAGQDVEERSEKIKAQKVAFITRKVGLTPAEAQKFWPVYNEYDEQRSKILEQRRSTSWYYIQNSSTLSEKETDEIIGRYISLQKQENELLEKYNAKFRQILPASKVMKLYVAEVEFKTWLLKQIRDNKTQGVK
ncbi:MAG: hypothetical protein GYA22_12730 [Bacteroidales bacterium]|nr:hypothetical protein [Bacteroidales bacterium]